MAARMSASTVLPAELRMSAPMVKIGRRRSSEKEIPTWSARTSVIHCRSTPGSSHSVPIDSPMPRARGGDTSEMTASSAGRRIDVVNSASSTRATTTASEGDRATPTYMTPDSTPMRPA